MTRQQPCGQVLIHRRFYLNPDRDRATPYIEQTYICITEKDVTIAQAAFESSGDPEEQVHKLEDAISAYLTDSAMRIFPPSWWKTNEELPLMEAGKAIAHFNEELSRRPRTAGRRGRAYARRGSA